MNAVETTSTDLLTRLPALEQAPIVGIIRGYRPEAAIEAARVAHGAGIQVLEVTMDSPGALEVVETLAESETGLTVGVGTVNEPGQVALAVEAGARFVVTPAFSVEVVSASLAAGLPILPGVATPTEIMAALRAGASGVKVFPAAQLGGPGYLRAIRAPLGHPPMVPTGGVSHENAAEYLESGAVALGAGSSLFSARVEDEGDWHGLDESVRRWMEAIR